MGKSHWWKEVVESDAKWGWSCFIWVGGGRLEDRGEECLIAVVNGVVGLQAVQL